MTRTVDWEQLRAVALRAMQSAYAPYSGFPVGAAGLADDGRVVTGCNVENASYGLTLCAECGLISNLLLTGGGGLSAFTCVDRDGNLLMPCGRCRQLLLEHATAGFLVDTTSGPQTIAAILPDAFGPDSLGVIPRPAAGRSR